MLGVGARLALACGSDASYFSSIDECIALSIAAVPAFLQSITYLRPCSGNVTVRTVDELEGLRYCGSLTGSLTIGVSDLTADYSALYDVETIQGLMQMTLQMQCAD